jgi:glyoxylate reductase/hydroxypyruvate reductase 2
VDWKVDGKTVMFPILSFPALAGMEYPKLNARGLIRVVDSEEEIRAIPTAERAGVRVLMTSASRGCSPEMVEALPDLAFVVSQGAGREKIAMTDLAARGVKVRCVGEALTDDVADLAMALMHMLCRNLLRADSFVRSGEWRRGRFPLGVSLVGLTLGVGGLSGRIGRAIAQRAAVSRMSVAGLDRPSNAGLGASLHDGWLALARASDVLVLALPESRETRRVIGAAELAALGPDGYLVNVARGSLVNTDALIEALENRRIAGAALDVLEGEPNISERLAALPNVVLTPHIGAQTWGQRERGARIAEDAVLAFLDGGDPFQIGLTPI